MRLLFFTNSPELSLFFALLADDHHRDDDYEPDDGDD
jgi:hypothetical protein